MKNKQRNTNNKIIIKIRKEYDSISKILFRYKYLLDVNDFSIVSTNSTDFRVTWSGKDNSLNQNYRKNLDTSERLAELIGNGQYTFLFYDYSILQVEYIVENDNITKQRIQFIKNNNYYYSIERMEEYRRDWIDDGDQFEFLNSDKGVPFIIRADFDPVNHKDLMHAKSHMTISNVENCRIPLVSNITLTKFILFILNNVYGEFNIKIPSTFHNNDTITEIEKNSLHLNWSNIRK